MSKFPEYEPINQHLDGPREPSSCVEKIPEGLLEPVDTRALDVIAKGAFLRLVLDPVSAPENQD